MTDSKPGIQEFCLSPHERKRRQELFGAVQVLQTAISELQRRVGYEEPNVRTRDLVSNSSKALLKIKQLMDAPSNLNH
jgi:hypothetical protein